MSLNDFEFVQNVEPEDYEKFVKAYGRYEESISGAETPRISLHGLIGLRDKAKATTDELIDAATELGWDMGVLEERSATLGILDDLENSLTDDEEDAKLTIGIIRKMLRERRKHD